LVGFGRIVWRGFAGQSGSCLASLQPVFVGWFASTLGVT